MLRDGLRDTTRTWNYTGGVINVCRIRGVSRHLTAVRRARPELWESCIMGFRFRDLSFRVRMYTLVGTFLLGLLLTHLMYAIVIYRVRVHGPLYDRIERRKDVMNDITPPAYTRHRILFGRASDRRQKDPGQAQQVGRAVPGVAQPVPRTAQLLAGGIDRSSTQADDDRRCVSGGGWISIAKSTSD